MENFTPEDKAQDRRWIDEVVTSWFEARYDYTAHVEYVRDLYITDGNINPERTNP